MCPSFVNTMTNEVQATPGPLWRGGLLADEMGLGKTLSMIALITSDHDHNPRNDPLIGYPAGEDAVRSTLIVVPLSCKCTYQLWRVGTDVFHSVQRLGIAIEMVYRCKSSEKRFLTRISHVRNGKLTWLMHHGRQRFIRKYNEEPPGTFNR